MSNATETSNSFKHKKILYIWHQILGLISVASFVISLITLIKVGNIERTERVERCRTIQAMQDLSSPLRDISNNLDKVRNNELTGDMHEPLDKIEENVIFSISRIDSYTKFMKTYFGDDFCSS